jgi:hypothetical protein
MLNGERSHGVMPRVSEGIAGLVARLAAGPKLAPALTAPGPRWGIVFAMVIAEAPH